MAQLLSSRSKLSIPNLSIKKDSELISLSLRIFLKSFWFITKVTIPFYLSINIFKELVLPDAGFSDSYHFSSFTRWIFGSFLSPVILFGVVNYLRFKKFPKILEAYHFGLKKWFLVLGQQFAAGVFVFLGFLMLIVPGVYLYLAYLLLVPVVCFENPRPLPWRAKSMVITLGHRSTIFIYMILLILISFLSSLLVSIPIEILFLEKSKPVCDVFIDLVFDVFVNVVVVFSLLAYLKYRKEKKKNKKEVWFIRWASGERVKKS